jgi:AAA+ ATPase superfamily predicted ATPase
MTLEFIDRKTELKTLTSLVDRKQAALVLLYGRRRVGKTRLIREFLKNKSSIYFYVPNAEEKTILSEFSKTVENEFFAGFKFADFGSFMEYLAKKSADGTIVAIDEFQRLTNIDGAVSLLQKFWDEKLSVAKSYLIFSGSSIGAVRKVALSGNAPLYGRRTATLKIEPLRFIDLFTWFENYAAEDLVKIYGSFGGTPAYLEHVSEKMSVEENIVLKILSKSSPLHDEPEMLLMEEIRTPQRYMDILTAVALGKNTLSEIADVSGLNRESTTVYLKTLEILDLIERVTPVTERDAKRGLYHLKDQFFSFWFRFVRPNKRQIELELENNVWYSVREEFNRYLGHVFEDVCLEVLVDMTKKSCLPIRLDKVGRWWWKETEIDILGLDTRSGKALALEVKWSNIDYHEAQRLISDLTTKTRQVKNAKEITIGLMAKRIEEKEKIRHEGFLALDLQDISEKFRTSKPAKNTV